MRDVPYEHLIDRGILEEVAAGGADERLWIDCDLASLAEHRLGDATDPRALDAARRARWAERATRDGVGTLRERSEFSVCCWLLENGERVGTLALSRMTYGGADARLASFYVFPTLRGRGVGRRALERLGAALAEKGYRYRLDTCWAWQRTVRFYQRAGLWVYGWKRDLTLCWRPWLPPPIVEFDANVATLSVVRRGERVELARARRKGDALALDEPGRALQDDPDIGESFWYATSTFSLALAMRAWPLVRSARAWEEDRYADGGAAEALAYKIAIWEAFDRAQGWRVETPRIPGLEYPTWEELEARWSRG